MTPGVLHLYPIRLSMQRHIDSQVLTPVLVSLMLATSEPAFALTNGAVIDSITATIKKVTS